MIGRSARRRPTRGLALLVTAASLACGDGPFSVEDAVGVWDLTAFNATVVPGDRPLGVWVHDAGAADSTLMVVRSFSITFTAGSACSWTFHDGISTQTTQNDCQYAVSEEGIISLDLVNLFQAVRAVTGTAVGDLMTLTDGATNELELSKRP